MLYMVLYYTTVVPAPLRLPGFQNFRLRLRSLIFNFFAYGSRSGSAGASPEPESNKKMFFTLSFAHTVFCFLEAFQNGQKLEKLKKWPKVGKIAKSLNNRQKLKNVGQFLSILSIITNFSTFEGIAAVALVFVINRLSLLFCENILVRSRFYKRL